LLEVTEQHYDQVHVGVREDGEGLVLGKDNISSQGNRMPQSVPLAQAATAVGAAKQGVWG